MNEGTVEPLYVRAYHLWARPGVTTILVALMSSPLGFNELRRAIPEISLKMLSERLRELVEAGLVERRVQSGPPLRTLYTLTPAGEGIRPVAEAFRVWHHSLPPEMMARLIATSGSARNGAATRETAETTKPRSGHPTFRLLSRRWAWSILRRLLGGPLSFNDLLRSIPAMPERIMATRLRELTHAGLVQRQVYTDVPLRTIYALTSAGEGLRPATEAMATWLASLSDAEAAGLLGQAGATADIGDAAVVTSRAT